MSPTRPRIIARRLTLIAVTTIAAVCLPALIASPIIRVQYNHIRGQSYHLLGFRRGAVTSYTFETFQGAPNESFTLDWHWPPALDLHQSTLFPLPIKATPIWPAFILGMIPAAIILPGAIRRRHRDRNHLCQRCGYPIANLSTCPECGTTTHLPSTDAPGD